jgi:hypothetical protein
MFPLFETIPSHRVLMRIREEGNEVSAVSTTLNLDDEPIAAEAQQGSGEFENWEKNAEGVGYFKPRVGA